MRVNEEITASRVRLVGENIEEQGIYPITQAMKMADELGLDLVEISAKADPPVCKIIDYQKYLYQQKKKAKEMEEGAVSVRRQGGKDEGSMSVESFAGLVAGEVKAQLA